MPNFLLNICNCMTPQLRISKTYPHYLALSSAPCSDPPISLWKAQFLYVDLGCWHDLLVWDQGGIQRTPWREAMSSTNSHTAAQGVAISRRGASVRQWALSLVLNPPRYGAAKWLSHQSPTLPHWLPGKKKLPGILWLVSFIDCYYRPGTVLSILYMSNNALRTIIAILQVRKLRNGSLSNMPVIIKLMFQRQHLNPGS